MAEIIAIDTPVFIYLFEDHPRFAPKAEKILRTLGTRGRTGVFSALGMIEILTGPKKKGNRDLAAEYEYRLRHFPRLSIVGLNDRIVWLASDLRAKYGIATPDAVHIATAIDAGAKHFITNDKALVKVKEIRAEIL